MNGMPHCTSSVHIGVPSNKYIFYKVNITVTENGEQGDYLEWNLMNYGKILLLMPFKLCFKRNGRQIEAIVGVIHFKIYRPSIRLNPV